MDLYAEQIIDLYKNPQNKGIMPNASLTHSGANVTCGDHVRIYIKVDGTRISDASFEGEGCAISIAAASLLTEAIKGQTASEISRMGTEDVYTLLGTRLGPARVKCGMLALETIQKCVDKSIDTQLLPPSI